MTTFVMLCAQYVCSTATICAYCHYAIHPVKHWKTGLLILRTCRSNTYMLRVETIFCDIPFKKEVIGSDPKALSLVVLIKSVFYLP